VLINKNPLDSLFFYHVLGHHDCIMSSEMAERIANARKEAEYLKDKIREKKQALNDTSCRSMLVPDPWTYESEFI